MLSSYARGGGGGEGVCRAGATGMTRQVPLCIDTTGCGAEGGIGETMDGFGQGKRSIYAVVKRRGLGNHVRSPSRLPKPPLPPKKTMDTGSSSTPPRSQITPPQSLNSPPSSHLSCIRPTDDILDPENPQIKEVPPPPILSPVWLSFSTPNTPHRVTYHSSSFFLRTSFA